ncbi:hypothetical protein TrRE_jg1527 [Triparma retinervis]|uniref:C2H2-type domain-containing protein n=1 Tax=Triparma retinervis TaxID=2557542 RepID=A0A9W7DMN2_9STRA|nr:hypothetical protein TrRE_jg1527 [Triparma retinervis]
MITQHLSSAHDIGVVWHFCPSCPYKSKSSSSLRQHLACVHSQGSVHSCGVPGCGYWTRNRRSMALHKLRPHGQDGRLLKGKPEGWVKQEWFYCGVEGCGYKIRGQNRPVRIHRAAVHGTGEMEPRRCTKKGCSFTTFYLDSFQDHLKRPHGKNGLLLSGLGKRIL